jgi:DNA-binding CsgD family transcriptional regulator
VAFPDPHDGQAAGRDAVRGDHSSGRAEPLAERLRRARLQPSAEQVPALGTPWLSALSDGSQRPVARVAALSEIAQTALRLGRVSECLAALAEQRKVAADDPAAQVWALTASAACRSVFGQLGQARADLAAARKACYYATPLLAEPFWRFAEIVCNWLGGDWAEALANAVTMDANQVSAFPPALAGTAAALRMELLRGLGVPGEIRHLANTVDAAGPAEISAWAWAGLDVDEGRPGDALRRLADVCDVGQRSVYRTALPLVLHRMAATAFACGERDVTAFAAAALAELDPAAPVNAILAGLAQAYATRNPAPARRAQELAQAEGAVTLVAEALTTRGQVGDDPAATLGAAHAAWQRVGAAARARAVAAAMRDAGLPAPRPSFRAAGGVPARGPVPLTARERSVALLVHEGRTNQQIAHVLNISVKTVEAYLTRLYRKTSCSSRVELAVAVTERRLNLASNDEQPDGGENPASGEKPAMGEEDGQA